MSTKAYDTVKLARANKRPTGLDYIHNLCGDFFELHGDRCYADDGAIVGGIGHFRGIPVTMIAIEKGHSAKERTARSFGAPHPEGYRKALRLMRQAEKFHRPVLCFVDTSGAYCGIGAEERGQGQAIAANLMGMMALNTPIITTLIGEGGSGGALALSVADRVWMLENAVYSVISPEGCASILWKDAGKADEAAEAHRLGCPGPGDHRAGDLGKGAGAERLLHPPGRPDREGTAGADAPGGFAGAALRPVPGPGEPLRPAPARPHPPHRPVTDWAGICPRRAKGTGALAGFVIYYR